MDGKTRSRIAELLAEGWSPQSIAVRLELASSTVSYHIDRLRSSPAVGESHRVDPDAVRRRVDTRERVQELLNEGVSRLETARRLGLSKATVSYHARRLGLPVDERGARRYDWQAVQRYYDHGHSMRDCVKAFGFSHDTWASAKNRGAIITRAPKTPTEELSVAGQPRNRGNLKRRMITDGLKPNSCALCGISEWLGKELALALHHINGDRFDNRLENLELLCPNCHSQTSTYSGRNGHRRCPAS